MLRPRKHVALATTTLGVIILGGAYALAQGAVGPFTATQVNAGRADYAANCAGCHNAGLTGMGDAPSLTGATFTSSWADKTTKELFQFVSTSMPYGNAGNLSEDTNANIVSYILAVNGAKPGSTPFSDIIGAIAVSGTPSGDIDATCSQAGLDRINAKLK